MFAAASGARLAHRHNKTVKKQNSAGQIEGLKVQYKSFQRQQQLKYSGTNGNRLSNIPHRRPNYSTKLYSDPNLKLSSSYIDINGRITKLGHVDFEILDSHGSCQTKNKSYQPSTSSELKEDQMERYAQCLKQTGLIMPTLELLLVPQSESACNALNLWWQSFSLTNQPLTAMRFDAEISVKANLTQGMFLKGKAAWQDRELNHDLEPRVSICVPNEAAITHRTKQREAHSRWVKRNRIHDLSFGDCSSDEELFYGVQSGAANLLLYVGLGTTCVGMIIAFVGTGEKGFKTMELRLIGPSLIGAGVLIIIFRIMLCICPSKCLRLRKHKLKNSMNKLNSEESQVSQELSSLKEPLREGDKVDNSDDKRKRVSIAILPTTSGLSTNSSETPKTSKANTESPSPFVVPTISYLENEKPDSSSRKLSDSGRCQEEKEKNTNLESKESCLGATSPGSEDSDRMNSPKFFETLISPDSSDVSMTSLINISPPHRGHEEAKKEVKISKFELSRNPKNLFPSGVVLSPSSLTQTKEAE